MGISGYLLSLILMWRLVECQHSWLIAIHGLLYLCRPQAREQARASTVASTFPCPRSKCTDGLWL